MIQSSSSNAEACYKGLHCCFRADVTLSNLIEPFHVQSTPAPWRCPDQGISLCANTNSLKLQPHQITQKWALGTWYSWPTLSSVALPSTYKMSISFGCISHSLSRAVKDYIKSSTYVCLDSCNKAMEQSEMEETSLEKMQQGAHACTQSAQENIWGLRGDRRFWCITCIKLPSKWLHLHWRLGPWHFNGPLSPMFVNTQSKRVFGDEIARGYSDKIKKSSQSRRDHTVWILWEVIVYIQDFLHG